MLEKFNLFAMHFCSRVYIAFYRLLSLLIYRYDYALAMVFVFFVIYFWLCLNYFNNYVKLLIKMLNIAPSQEKMVIPIKNIYQNLWKNILKKYLYPWD